MLDATALTTDDLVLVVGVGAIAAAVVISFAIFSRYRSLTVEASKSNQLAKDLWSTLESRLKKQDERIVDLMARMELYGAKVERGRPPATVMVQAQPTVRPSPTLESDVGPSKLEVSILDMLSQRAYNTKELTDALKKSREHTARVMKQLFDAGFVVRNDRDRPFTYEITDAGRRYLTDRRSAGT